MKIRFSKNIDAIGGDSEIAPEEIVGTKGLNRVARLSKEAIAIAYYIFEKHPEFKQVTLDTMTDEERRMIEVSQTKTELS